MSTEMQPMPLALSDSKITKAAIRATLAPMSKALLGGSAERRIDFMGLKITCRRLYGSPGQVGPAWNPDFSAINPAIGKVVHGGSLTDIVDQLYRRSRGHIGAIETAMTEARA